MADRKARLAALAAKAGRDKQPNSSSNDGGNDQEVSEGSKKPKLSFRNYVPKDASLDASAAPADDGAQQSSTKRQKTSEQQGNKEAPTEKSALELALAKTSRESREAAGQNAGAGGSSWSTVTPVSTKKVNWDLKRDIQHKMDKLERRTQRAIVDLLRGRLAKEAAEGGGDMDDSSDLD